jgi:hypothetical protein
VAGHILQTLQHKRHEAVAEIQPPEKELAKRKSPRLKEKYNSGRSVMKLAQDVIAKKCVMEAIIKLSNVAQVVKKKKRQNKEKKAAKESKKEMGSKSKISQEMKKGAKSKKSKKKKLTPTGVSA